MSEITVRKLVKTFGDHRAIAGADFSVSEGEFVALVGESGCGKTTTLRCIAGLESPTAGNIEIGDRTIFDSDRRVEVPPEAREIGMVFQSYALWPHMTVLETVMYPLRRHRLARSAAIERALDTLDALGLKQYAKRSSSSLSGGQQQRVALARALVSQPQVMLYDEPLSNLDPSLRRNVRDEILRMHQENGTTSLYVTHDLEEAMFLADRVIVMQHGMLEQSGPPSEIFSRPTSEFVARFVGFENLLEGRLVETDATTLSVRVERMDQTFRVPRTDAGASMAVGDDVLFGFRADNAQVFVQGEEPPLGHLVVPARIERTTFFGSRNEFWLTAGAASIRVAESEREYRTRSEVRAAGMEARIALDPELCVVIPRATSEGARA
ncbi:MAG: ABC transporter ATP-binding protein [Leucobacter sp.]|nr:ABC transporter ATP-binding protein [Leucobacter sp.]